MDNLRHRSLPLPGVPPVNRIDVSANSDAGCGMRTGRTNEGLPVQANDVTGQSLPRGMVGLGGGVATAKVSGLRAGELWSGSGRRVGASVVAAVAVALTMLVASHPAQAGHGMNEGHACYDCHDLNSKYAEPDTNYLSSSKRNISTIKAAWAVAGNNTNGKVVPDEFGCLYCHNSPVPKADEYTGVVSYRMRDASTHFRGKASSHPVGFDLTQATPTDTSGHLLSTFDCYNGVVKRDPNCQDSGATADNLGDRSKELDCVDCHDVRQSSAFQGYPQHGKPLAANPFMLRAGVGGFNLATAEYDDVCRRCHGTLTGAGAHGDGSFKSTGKNLRLTVHPDASDTATNVMKEPTARF